MIQYDNFHNPIRIQFANGSVTRYVYSADGAKLRTVHYTAMPNITVATGTIHELTAAETQAVDSVDYLLGGNLLLRNGRIDKYLFEGGYCEAYKPVTCIAKPFIPTFDGFIEPSKENMERIGNLMKAWEKAKEANFNMDTLSITFTTPTTKATSVRWWTLQGKWCSRPITIPSACQLPTVIRQ